MLHLPEPYATALDQAVAWLHATYEPIAIIACGSIIRGTPHATSDLDLVVIHEQPWRQRAQRFFNGVPAEMFVNPVFQLRRQMVNDAEAGRPVMAHMLDTGAIVEDPTGVLAALREEARANLAAGPTVSNGWLVQRRYWVVTNFEDAVDLLHSDPDRAQTIVTESLVEAARLHFLQQGRWLPRSKALLADLEGLDPALAAQVRAALRATDLEERLSLAAAVIERTCGVAGFFEWDSEPQDVNS